MELSLYGWDDDYSPALARACAEHRKPLEAGRVVASNRGWCRVMCASGERDAILSGALLESEGLIAKTIYPVVPPKTEYNLTEKGRAILPVIAAMAEFGRVLQHGEPATAG